MPPQSDAPRRGSSNSPSWSFPPSTWVVAVLELPALTSLEQPRLQFATTSRLLVYPSCHTPTSSEQLRLYLVPISLLLVVDPSRRASLVGAASAAKALGLGFGLLRVDKVAPRASPLGRHVVGANRARHRRELSNGKLGWVSYWERKSPQLYIGRAHRLNLCVLCLQNSDDTLKLSLKSQRRICHKFRDAVEQIRQILLLISFAYAPDQLEVAWILGAYSLMYEIEVYIKPRSPLLDHEDFRNKIIRGINKVYL
ncbi:hypothetical protein EJB05_10917, partial [Eragrostis curvula]